MLRLATSSYFFGSIIIFAQIISLYFLLDTKSFVEFRSVINTSNYLGIVFTLGIVDSAHFSVNKKNINLSEYTGISAFFIFLAYMFLILFLYLFTSLEEREMLTMGALLGLITSIYLLLVTTTRIRGDFHTYFISTNLGQRIYRTFLIVGAALVSQDVNTWFQIVLLGFLIHILFFKYRNGIQISFAFDQMRNILKNSMPFFLVSFFMISLTRYPYFSALFAYDDERIKSMDISLTAMFFILVPFLNQYDISEIKSNFLAKDFISDTKKTRNERINQHRIIFIFIAFFVIGIDLFLKGEFINFAITSGLIMIGMSLIVSGQNYLAILQLISGYKTLIKSLFLFIVSIAAISFISSIISFPYSVEIYFIFLTLVYVFQGNKVWEEISGEKTNSFFDYRILMDGLMTAASLIIYGVYFYI